MDVQGPERSDHSIACSYLTVCELLSAEFGVHTSHMGFASSVSCSAHSEVHWADSMACTAKRWTNFHWTCSERLKASETFQRDSEQFQSLWSSKKEDGREAFNLFIDLSWTVRKSLVRDFSAVFGVLQELVGLIKLMVKILQPTLLEILEQSQVERIYRVGLLAFYDRLLMIFNIRFC